jgi:hypothetical protein
MKLNKIKTMIAAAVLAGTMTFPCFAAQGWQEEAQTWYYYDENGERVTGWIQDPNSSLWYELDEETAAWIEKPMITEISAQHLLENAIRKAGYYQNEEAPVEVVVTSSDKSTIYASVRLITGPNSYTNLNNYEINRKTGYASGTSGTSLDLYQ